MVEAKFPAKLRSGGKVKIITVPFEILEFYGLKDQEMYEIVIRSKPKSGMSNLWKFHENYGVTV